MTQEELAFAEVPLEKFDLLSREDLIALARGEQSLRLQMQDEVKRLRAQYEELKQRSFLIEDQLVTIKSKIFGKSSEKSKLSSDEVTSSKKSPSSRVLLPSERYPDATVVERHVEFEELPSCRCCESQMRDTGMCETSEFLTMIPQQYLVIRQMRHKYSCGKCHGEIRTAPAPPRIREGSSYSDEMMIDVSLSKYCDLIMTRRSEISTNCGRVPVAHSFRTAIAMPTHGGSSKRRKKHFPTNRSSSLMSLLKSIVSNPKRVAVRPMKFMRFDPK